MHFRRSLILAMLLAGTAVGQTQPSATDDPSRVKKAATDFLLSLAETDLKHAKALYAGSDENFKLVAGMHDMLQATQKLKLAAEERWPKQFDPAGPSKLDADGLVRKMRTETLAIDGDAAQFSGGLTLRRIDGQWKVVDLIATRDGKLTMANMLPILTQAATETADEVRKGAYPTFDSAQVALGNKINKAMQSAATTQPMKK